MENGKVYRFAEVPSIGFALDRKPSRFGYKELFAKSEPIVEAYISQPENLSIFEGVVGREAQKGTLKTIVLGVGGVGGLVYTGSTVGSLLSIWGVCPYCVPGLAVAVSPFAGIPVAAVMGIPIGKRLGQRRAIRKILGQLQNGKTSVEIVDYSPLEESIIRTGVAEKVQAYAQAQVQGAKGEKILRLIHPPKEFVERRRDLANDFQILSETADRLIQDQESFRIVRDAYRYVRDIYARRFCKDKKVVVFGT